MTADARHRFATALDTRPGSPQCRAQCGWCGVHIWQCTLQSLYINQINSPPQYWQILRLIFWDGSSGRLLWRPPSMSQLFVLVVLVLDRVGRTEIEETEASIAVNVGGQQSVQRSECGLTRDRTACLWFMLQGNHFRSPEI